MINYTFKLTNINIFRARFPWNNAFSNKRNVNFTISLVFVFSTVFNSDTVKYAHTSNSSFFSTAKGARTTLVLYVRGVLAA